MNDGNEQRWDHCLLTHDGGTWLICNKEGNRVYLFIPPNHYSMVDVTWLDHEGYAAAALALLDRRYPGWRE